jgi:hypothetical protein
MKKPIGFRVQDCLHVIDVITGVVGDKPKKNRIREYFMKEADDFLHGNGGKVFDFVVQGDDGKEYTWNINLNLQGTQLSTIVPVISTQVLDSGKSTL